MLTRRHFLGTLAGITASLAWPRRSGARDNVGEPLPLRKLGRADEQVTMLGLGGAHVGDLRDPVAAQRQIDVALEQGIRFFDNAEAYGRGRSESYYGSYLTPKYGEIAFLMTKSGATDADTAKRHLDQSLQRMATDHVDLWQMHDLKSPEDVDARFEGGVVDVFLQAKADGKTRYIGFTGHTSPHAHRRMLERLKEKGVEFDALQMPMNVVDSHYESFIVNVMPEAVERGYAVLAMKTLAYGQILGRPTAWQRQGGAQPVVPEAMTVERALSFVWSLPVTVLITGTHSPEELAQNCGFARAFTEIDEAGRRAIVDAVAKYDARGIEFYKA